MKKILSTASEAVPFIKAGGLADAVGSLPRYLDKEYFDVRVIIPRYLCIKQEWRDKMEYVNHFYIGYLGQSHYVGILQYVHEDITLYFIDNESYFNGAKPYGDWYWDSKKFCFFCRAVLSALPVIGFRLDVVYCRDWQTGLIPVLLKDKLHEGEFFRNMKSVIIIHNLKFQDVWDAKAIKCFTEPSDYHLALDKLEVYKGENLLKGGIVYTGAIITINNTYAEEIRLPFYDEGLDGLMRSRVGNLRGIVDGIDYDEFSPEIDTYIAQTHNAKNLRKEKVEDKKALQQGLGLPVDEKTLMVGVVSCLTDQKGFDLIQCVMDELCNDDLQLVVLGTGEERYENTFRHYDWKHHDRVSVQIHYSEAMSHKIYAASDAFLMLSLFELCDLNQLMTLRYGTVPIVRKIDGLKDTVELYNEYESTDTGFSFANYNAHEMLGSMRYAKYVCSSKHREWNKIIDRVMAKDYS